MIILRVYISSIDRVDVVKEFEKTLRTIIERDISDVICSEKHRKCIVELDSIEVIAPQNIINNIKEIAKKLLSKFNRVETKSTIQSISEEIEIAEEEGYIDIDETRIRYLLTEYIEGTKTNYEITFWISTKSIQ